jgi:hypothetical protein
LDDRGDARGTRLWRHSSPTTSTLGYDRFIRTVDNEDVMRLRLGVIHPDEFENLLFLVPNRCRLTWTRVFSTWHQVRWAAVERGFLSRGGH